jgi:hypothetical protein
MLNEIDLSRTDLNLLVLFEAVLRESHVGRAADRLSLTPSAVSHGLGRLRRLLNDPLFLKTPKGVVPTARAIALQGPVSDALARVRSIVSSAGPFDPATSTRRFTIGAPDGASAVFLPSLLADLRRSAPAWTSPSASCCRCRAPCRRHARGKPRSPSSRRGRWTSPSSLPTRCRCGSRSSCSTPRGSSW